MKESIIANLDYLAEKAEARHQKILSSLEEAGFREKLPDDLMERLLLLEEESMFNEDARRVERAMDQVMDFLSERYGLEYPVLNLSESQKVEGRIAAIVHDIGKTGPLLADYDQRLAVVKLFASEEIKNPQMLIYEAVQLTYLDDSERITEDLESIGIDTHLTMRQFWDMHAHWTHDILEHFPEALSRRIRVIAASHHYDHGINPYDLPESDIPLQATTIGLIEDYASELQERVLVAVDQYEANIRRSGSSHEKAIAWVRENLAKSNRFKNDKIIPLICEAIDELGRGQEIFEPDLKAA